MLKVEIGDVIVNPDEIYDVDVGGMEHTMNETQSKNITFLKNSGKQLVKTTIIRRKIEKGNAFDPKAFFEWFKKTEPKEVKIIVSVPTTDGNEEVIYTITLKEALPVRWYFEHIESKPGLGNQEMDLDCIEIAAQDIEVS